MTEPMGGLVGSWYAPVCTMNFAIDFDDTITAAPKVIAAMVHAGKARGHKFYCVTARSETEDSVDFINSMLDEYDIQMPIIFTSLGSKLEAVADRGIVIDVWVGDDPRALVHGH
jgi:hypothetical protein